MTYVSSTGPIMSVTSWGWEGDARVWKALARDGREATFVVPPDAPEGGDARMLDLFRRARDALGLPHNANCWCDACAAVHAN